MDNPDFRRGNSTEAVVKQRLRDLLLRFPCTLLEGLRWSVLCKVFRERFPDGAAVLQAKPDAEVRAWLADLAVFEADADVNDSASTSRGTCDGRLLLRDVVASMPPQDGQMACWPLLVQRLAEIVRTEGNPQQAHLLEAPQEMAPACCDEMQSEPEVMGVLLAQLKRLLRRHWDPAFEERAIGYFNETGLYVGVKKMKHLVTSLLTWRSQRRALSRHRQEAGGDGATASVVDTMLEVPLVLTVSQRHNDMMLCCPAKWKPILVPSAEERLQHTRPALDSCIIGSGHDLCESIPSSCSLPAGFRGGGEGTSVASDAVFADVPRSPHVGTSTQRIDMLEMESRRLRIENAELKKRLRFGADYYNAELRRLRIENAELKKRLFFQGDTMANNRGGQAPYANTCNGTNHVGPQQNFPQNVWVPAPVLTPVVPSSNTQSSHGAGENVQAAGYPSVQPHGLPSSGCASPSRQQGSLTPVAQGFCYVPVAAYAQPLMAVPVAAAGQFIGGAFAASVISPSTPSDTSFQDRLLPKSLFSSDPSSHAEMVSDSASPVRWQGFEASGSSSAMQLGATDDRWRCIPSGIVDRNKAQFEARQHADGGAAEGPAESALAAPQHHDAEHVASAAAHLELP